jgi:hypothetical protein
MLAGAGAQKFPVDTSDTAARYQTLILKKEGYCPSLNHCYYMDI